jgi:hypothetical protein
MKTFRRWFVITSLIVSVVSSASAKSVQEGWYKVNIGAQHAGFFVQRIEFDAAKKTWGITTYLKTSALGGNLVESVQSTSSKDLAPISYMFATQSPNEAKTIKADLVGKKIHVKTTKGDKTESKDIDYKPGVFWSSALLYVMLNSKEGLKVGNSFSYDAVAEEDGKIYPGTAVVSGEEEFRGVKCFKILNTFKGAKYASIVSETGVIYSVRHPLDSLEVTMVDSREEAAGKITVSDSTMKTLFGTEPVKSMLPELKIPVGSEPPKKLSAPAAPTENADKKIPEGLSVPAGKGK